MSDKRHDELLAALIIWEAMLDDKREYYEKTHKEPPYLEENVGVYTHREAAISLAKPMEMLWDYLCRFDYEASYDWEFVPIVLSSFKSPDDLTRFAADPIAWGKKITWNIESLGAP